MCTPNRPSDFFEILTTEEVLARLKIGRTKLFELKKKGKLIPGRHFFKNGGILRFVWGPDLIMALHEDPAQNTQTTDQKNKASKQNQSVANKRSPINMEY